MIDFCFTSKTAEHLWGDLFALGFLTVTDGSGGSEFLSVDPSEVETIDASRMALYCC